MRCFCAPAASFAQKQYYARYSECAAELLAKVQDLNGYPLILLKMGCEARRFGYSVG